MAGRPEEYRIPYRELQHGKCPRPRMSRSSRLRHSEKLASVGKLAAGVTHEINNPLGGILNCLYNIRKGALSPTRQEEYLASMEHGVQRVQKIVRQLLDFSQQHEPEFSPTDINQIVNQVLALTAHLFVPNRIRLIAKSMSGGIAKTTC